MIDPYNTTENDGWEVSQYDEPGELTWREEDVAPDAERKATLAKQADGSGWRLTFGYSKRDPDYNVKFRDRFNALGAVSDILDNPDEFVETSDGAE